MGGTFDRPATRTRASRKLVRPFRESLGLPTNETIGGFRSRVEYIGIDAIGDDDNAFMGYLWIEPLKIVALGRCSSDQDIGGAENFEFEFIPIGVGGTGLLTEQEPHASER
jgi:hypothetical protein